MFSALEADMWLRIIELDEENKQLKTEIKHNKQLWKSAFHAYKNLKKKVETTLFPVEYIDFIDHACSELLGEGDRVASTFVMPWCKVKEYLNKKYNGGEK